MDVIKQTKMQNDVTKSDLIHYHEHSAVKIVHEIRNPLTTIKGFIQLLKPYLKDSGKEQYADVVLSEINRTNEMLYEFLSSFKEETTCLAPVTSLNQIVRDTSTLFECEATVRNIDLITTLTDQDIPLEIPANHLKQILINLVKNAMEAIDESHIGIIHLTTINEGDFATVQIKDNGCGMSEETINKIFIPYYTTKKKGTGIGLWVCKEKVEEYEGSIHVKSTMDEGTTFSISFPIKSRNIN